MTMVVTPQTIGMIAGCCVFVATVATVAVLLVAGGSLERLREQASQQPKDAEEASTPRLTEELLQAAASPMAPLPRDLWCSGRLAATCRSSGSASARVCASCDESQLAVAMDGSAAKWGAEPFGDARRIWQEDGEDVRKLAIVDERDPAAPVVGALGLSNLRPRHLAVRLHLVWLHPAYIPSPTKSSAAAAAADSTLAHLALLATIDALFDAHFRRVEFVADVADAPRRRLAESLGFVLEGVLRKHMIVNERNRDSALYSLLNTDWKYSSLRPNLVKRLGYRTHHQGESNKAPAAKTSFPTPPPSRTPKAASSPDKRD